ncbi:hypothetical protein HLB23_21805 [Nocardia uniformis]|uniref:Uncharacterized protein n=1 Tax=Nocardia uniformis TaxID=53432 RepID=A0A849CG88_9NOCA|nr:hypothetical protein [Nocardia uniformis]NNH72461.1 hypothetical protein [Nocardia uniformis]
MKAGVGKVELIQFVERSLGVLHASYRGFAKESDLYEAALLYIAVEAAHAAGGNSMITYDGMTATTQVRFRCSPGNLWAPGFTYVRVLFPEIRETIEIHLGVKVAGSSGVAHECDVAILERDEADRSRQSGAHPKQSKLIAAIEAKNYSASPELGVGRGFVGLSAELTKANCNLVFPAKGRDNITKLIAKRKSGMCFDEVTPISPAAERLRSYLETVLRNWVATRRVS